MCTIPSFPKFIIELLEDVFQVTVSLFGNGNGYAWARGHAGARGAAAQVYMYMCTCVLVYVYMYMYIGVCINGSLRMPMGTRRAAISAQAYLPLGGCRVTRAAWHLHTGVDSL